jgi:cobalt/nickel transport system permease protein
MHIHDGILPAPICIGGYAITALATWYSLHRIHRSVDPTAGIPKASLLTAAFFVASSLHIPIPPASVHLVLNGLLGTLLGYYAFPAIVIGLFFQAEMFGHGGLSTLGVNAALMGIPALLAYYLFQIHSLLETWWGERPALGIAAFLSGALGLGLATAIFFGIVLTTIPSELDRASETAAVYVLVLAHLPLMILEGVFTTLLVLFLHRVKPELLKTEW